MVSVFLRWESARPDQHKASYLSGILEKNEIFHADAGERKAGQDPAFPNA